MGLLAKLSKSVIFYSFVVILGWVVYLFITGGYICSTVEVIDGKGVDTGEIKCFYNSPLQFSLNSINKLSHDLPSYGLGLMVIIIPVVLLILRDSYFQNKGVSQKEIQLNSITWMISPFMIIMSLLFIYGSWWIATREGQVGSFIFGAGIGTIGGIWRLYKVLSAGKKQLEKMRLIIPTVFGIFILLTLIINNSSLEPEIYSFLGNNKFLANFLRGSVSLFTLFASLIHLLLAVRRKYSLLNF